MLQIQTIDRYEIPKQSFYGTNEDSPTFIVVGENDKIVNKTVLKSSVQTLITLISMLNILKCQD